MVRYARYAIDDRFFSISVLDEIVRNEEDFLHEPLCVPDDPLGTISIYPMKDIQLLLGSLSPNSPPTVKYENTGEESIGLGASKEKREKSIESRETIQTMRRSPNSLPTIKYENTGEESIGLGGSKEKREKSIKSTETIQTMRCRGRPKKNIRERDSSSTSDLRKIEAVHSPDTRKRKRSRKIVESSSSSDSEPPKFEKREKLVAAIQSSRRLKRSRRQSQTNSWSLKLPILQLVECPDASKRLETIRRCSHCRAESTPQWRLGPNGPGTLCNACGIKYKAGRLAI